MEKTRHPVEQKYSRRVALGVEYRGSRYHGWQKQQAGVSSVQECLESVLSQIANETIELTCAGRTDAGVHATRQVVHFDVQAERKLKAWVYGANALLPDDIGINWATEVPTDFHARFSALSRRYLYVIYPHKIRPTLMNGLVTQEYRSLDVERMHEAGQCLLGERDFTSFRGSNCQSNTPMRDIKHLNVVRTGRMICIDICANAFLLHMVRNVAGVLMDIGAGEKDPSWCETLLEAKDRTLASITAPADGLYLVDVEYPDSYRLQPGPAWPDFYH